MANKKNTTKPQPPIPTPPSPPERGPGGEATEATEAGDAALREELALTLRINAELESKVRELAARLPSAPLPATTEGISFMCQGVRFGFAIPRVRYHGKVITATDVMQNPALQAELVNGKNGMVKML